MSVKKPIESLSQLIDRLDEIREELFGLQKSMERMEMDRMETGIESATDGPLKRKLD